MEKLLIFGYHLSFVMNYGGTLMVEVVPVLEYRIQTSQGRYQVNPVSLNLGVLWGDPKGHKPTLRFSREKPLCQKLG
jgi:hypothetical protein